MNNKGDSSLLRILQSRISLRRNKIKYFEEVIHEYKAQANIGAVKLYRGYIEDLVILQKADKKLYALVLDNPNLVEGLFQNFITKHMYGEV